MTSWPRLAHLSDSILTTGFDDQCEAGWKGGDQLVAVREDMAPVHSLRLLAGHQAEVLRAGPQQRVLPSNCPDIGGHWISLGHTVECHILLPFCNLGTRVEKYCRRELNIKPSASLPLALFILHQTADI